ncbi:MAG: DNA translocase FtsK [Ferruginibacter sp.]|nr:DNA translocase FtsK [Cytophagales bacterium]
MAKNTFKDNPPKRENKEKEGRPLSGALGKPLIRWQPAAWLRDQRVRLIGGFLLLLTSVYLVIAFTSYLFTGKADQSTVDAVFDTTLRDSGKEVENWLGTVGAVVSHVLVFRWFGIASFLLAPILFLTGWKVVFRRELFPLGRLSRFSAFAILWVSCLLGYLVLVSREESNLGFLSGGIGYELALVLQSLLGWGTLFLIGFALLAFVILFFNVTSVRSFNRKLNETIQEIETVAQEDVLVRNPVKEPLSDAPSVEVEEELVEASFAARRQLETTQRTDFVIPSRKEGAKSAAGPPDLTLRVEDTRDTALRDTALRDAGIRGANPPQFVEETLVEKVDEEAVKALGLYDSTLDLPQYQFPPLDLLNENNARDKAEVSWEELEANKEKIVETLANYSIGITSIKATIGPTVTLYEIIPDAGVRIAKIKNLEDDIALSLAALGIRIIAPIPGKGTIGIEVPNKNREMVPMRSVLMSEKFQKTDKELPIVLGKTISNEVYVADLAKMPHLLMAGATGQGKSVGLNVILASLIYKKHPSQLKFVLVDPKKVELTLFNTLERHFLAMLPGGAEPIITDTKKVVDTLHSLCIEMDMRYNLLKEAGCRNLKEYNAKFIQRRLNPEKGHRFMPYIVLIIDELADLMMTAGKEVEQPIARLAQLARAIGIHLVVATQRPSVNVITGIIKANFPARLSFKVTSKIDSRTILDTGGAEQLVGKGDMLLSADSDIIRLQCAFLDTPEVERICEFIGSQRGYDSAYLLPEFEGDSGGESTGDFDVDHLDPLFEEAARCIVMHQQGSTSLLQRRLKLGYNRAGRLIDQLEHAGVVGPFEGSKAREVLIADEYSLEQLLSNFNK